MSCNEVSPTVRVPRPERPTSRDQVHQSEHAPNGCFAKLPPLVLAQVAPASLNEPPSLSSSLTSAPSVLFPPTPQSKRSPTHRRRHCSAFETPLAQSRIRAQGRHETEWEAHTPTPSRRIHSHAAREPRADSHRCVSSALAAGLSGLDWTELVALVRTLYIFVFREPYPRHPEKGTAWDSPGSGPVRFSAPALGRCSGSVGSPVSCVRGEPSFYL